MDDALLAIIAQVAARHQVPIKVLIGPNRLPNVCRVRGEAMAQARMGGFKVSQIAQAFGRGEGTVFLLLKKHRDYVEATTGTAPPRPRHGRQKGEVLSPEEKAEIAAGRRAGVSYGKIAAMLNRPLKTVENAGAAILKRESAPGGGKIEPAIVFHPKTDERFVEAVMAAGGYPVARSPIPPKPAEMVVLYSKRLIYQARGGAVLP
jgi:hypothetical protein